MRRWGFFPNGVEYDKVVDQVNRADIWRECAKAIGQEAMIPAIVGFVKTEICKQPA